MTSAQSNVLTPSRAHFLAHGNLITIYGNPNLSARLAAMPDIYTPDVVVYEPDNEVLHGYGEINAHVSKLLAERAGWGFVMTGEVKHNADYVGVTWGFGPKDGEGKVDVKITGSDVIIVEKGGDEVVRIKRLYVILDGVADAKA